MDVETDEPVFGTVKEGFIVGRHLTFVPLQGAGGLARRAPGQGLKGASRGCTEHRSRGRTSATG